MTKNLEILIAKLEKELPDLCTPEALLKIGLGGNHTQLFRIRKNGDIPFIKLTSARILYLKTDVIDWLKQSYVKEEEGRDLCRLK
jgi:hypothetical protein